jgi:hypothetical protein
VESVEGQGSTFWLDLPAAAHDDYAAPGAPVRAEPAGLPPMRLLLVDDNATDRAVMQAFFQSRPGWQLLMAEEGGAGLRLAREHRPDVVVLDLHLPGHDGFEVLAALREAPDTAAIPVIALTADARPDARERGLRAGFAAYLTKPVDFEELLAAMAHLVA